MVRGIRSFSAILVIGSVAGLFGQHSAIAREPAISSVQRDIIRLEHRWIANEYNPAVLQVVLADDFVHVLPEGFISKQEQIAFVRSHSQPRFTIHKFARLTVRIYGRAAIANGVVVSEQAGENAPQSIFFTDVFAFRNGRWQAVNAQETPAAFGKR